MGRRGDVGVMMGGRYDGLKVVEVGDSVIRCSTLPICQEIEMYTVYLYVYVVHSFVK